MLQQIPAEVRDRVEHALDECERTEDVIVFLAVESGSRAWGFPSRDSDYDVRFLYVHRPDWYLSIDLERRRDVIERPIDRDLDISGWDLRKALRLLRKSNPPLLEWLQCPIVYRERSTLPLRLREFIPGSFRPESAYHHYLHMAQRNFREYLRGDTVWVKKYLYVLRPLLAVRWIERGLGAVPIEFGKLVDATVIDPGLKGAIQRLVNSKMAGAELDRGPRIESISGFVEAELDRLEHVDARRPDEPVSTETLNEFFRSALRETWGTP